MHISSKKMLEQTIIDLEKRKAAQHEGLIDQLHETTESLKPGNLLKSAFSRVKKSPEARSGIIKSLAGFGMGMITKRLFMGKSPSFVRKIVGNALRLGVAKTAINNTDKVRAYGTAIYNNLFKRKKAQYKKLL